MLEEIRKSGVPLGGQREVYLEWESEEAVVVELQLLTHGWNRRLAENAERVLGAEARGTIMQGSDKIDPLTPLEERVEWLAGALCRLDELADDDQKYDVMSNCAHRFAQERIDKLKAIYEHNHDLDDVLKSMEADPLWYESPSREGNTIYLTKIPVNVEEYEKATTPKEKKFHYCHCSLVRNNLDKLPPTFCLCGAGWYRQLWEGIIGQPVRIEKLGTLLTGADDCRVAIHLPL